MKATKLMFPLIGGAAASALAYGAYYWWNYDTLVTFPAYQAPIVDQLRDPVSAQTRNERIAASGWICGELNSKNSSGGYVGFKRYISGGRAGSYFLEDHGPVGERNLHESTQDVIDRLDRKTKLLEEFIRMRESLPGLQRPSDAALEEQVTDMVFEEQWKKYCGA